MKIRVKAGHGVVIATHVGQGDERRMLFVSPWGCSLSVPKQVPRSADLSSREYIVDVAGECERLLRAALAAKHPGLASRIEVIDEPKPATKPAKPAKDEPKL